MLFVRKNISKPNIYFNAKSLEFHCVSRSVKIDKRDVHVMGRYNIRFSYLAHKSKL